MTAILSPNNYGPWAIVAGASDGVGAAFAEKIAGSGVNVVLLARRADLLDEVAAGIRQRTGCEARVIATDLAVADASHSIIDATSDLDIGLLVYCAGADPDYVPFLENSITAAERMLQRNCLVPMQLIHHYGQRMVERGNGGVIVLSSGAAFVGAANMVAYSATKAFDMILTEALWCEWKTKGVDALVVILGETDTPALRRMRFERGLAGANEPVPGATPVEDVVAAAFKHLGRGPTCMAGKQVRWGARLIFPIPRGILVRMMAWGSSRAMGTNDNRGR